MIFFIFIIIILFTVLQIASFLLYLSDVEEGGETMFPYEVRSWDIHSFIFLVLALVSTVMCWTAIRIFFPQNGSNMGTGYDYEKCIGLKVKPRKGDGLLFYSLYLNGTIDKV